jgi:flagellar hook protein FlgE
MIGALWTGISGLAGQQTALDNESNNIANVNTVGFKASRISFADQMYQNKIGKGTQILDAEKIYSQGNLKLTGVSYDMALAGDGFFAVSNTRGGGTSETYYTRAGNFRMGDSGTLQDTIGNEVQGWAVSDEPLVESSNPNIDIFTNDYTKLLSSKIVSYTNAVETITAKATDFTLTAQSDNEVVFSGFGRKTKYGKIADVEELVKSYTKALQNLKDDPNSSSAKATAQTSYIDLPNQGTSDAIGADGDEVYVYIDGNKISQSFISGTANNGLTALEDGYIKTMKAFSDKISEIPGIKAYVADDDLDNDTVLDYSASTAAENVKKGILRIESIVPGEPFTISSTGMVHSGNDKPGTYAVLIESDSGKGLGALESARDALNQAINGKQQDVFTESELGTGVAGNTYTYSVSIYDKGLDKTVEIPNDGAVPTPSVTPLALSGGIDNMVSLINNNNSLNIYVEATNINGSLVIRTIDSNFDVEFSGDLELVTSGEIQTLTIAEDDPTVGATAQVSFLGQPVAGSTNGDDANTTVNKIVADKVAIMNTWNTAHAGPPATRQIADIQGSGSDITIVYEAGMGDVANITVGAAADHPNNGGMTYTESVESVASAGEQQTIKLSGTTTGAASFLGRAIAGSVANESADETVARIVADKANIMATWNDAATGNPDMTIVDILGEGDTITVIYDAADGDVPNITIGAFGAGTGAHPSNNGIIYAESEDVEVDVKRSADYSGREGAGAEFMEIKTRIDQTASKGSMQLRLDSLNISDSAFGDFAVDETGLITMSQDGAMFAVGQVAIAKFITNRGLEPIGNNLLQATLASGDPIYNLNNDKTAEIKANTLELSTADLSESLVNLMVFQRAFEANAKSITTADTVLNTLIQLKR